MSITYPVAPGWYQSDSWTGYLHIEGSVRGEWINIYQGKIEPGDVFYIKNTINNATSTGEFVAMKSGTQYFYGCAYPVGADFASQCSAVSNVSEDLMGDGIYINTTEGVGTIALNPSVNINKGDVFQVVHSGGIKTARKLVHGTTPSWTNYDTLTSPLSVNFMDFYGFEGCIIFNMDAISHVQEADVPVQFAVLALRRDEDTWYRPDIQFYPNTHGKVLNRFYGDKIADTHGRLWYCGDNSCMTYTAEKNGVHEKVYTSCISTNVLLFPEPWSWTVELINGATTLPEVTVHDVIGYNAARDKIYMDIEVRSDYAIPTGSIVKLLYYPVSMGYTSNGAPDISIGSYFNASLGKYMNRKIIAFQVPSGDWPGPIDPLDLLQIKFQEGTHNNWAFLFAFKATEEQLQYWNLLSNGYFETGDFSNWVQINDSLVPDGMSDWQISSTPGIPIRGNYCATFENVGLIKTSKILCQSFEVEAGLEYQISVYAARTAGTSNSRLYANVLFHQDQVKIIDTCNPWTSFTGFPPVDLTTGLVKYSYVFKALKSQTLYFALYAYAEASGLTVIDDVQICRVD